MNKNRNNLFTSACRAGLGLLLLAAAGGCATTKPIEAPRRWAFWPPYPDEPRIQFLVSFQRSTDIEPPKNTMDRLIYGKDPQPVLPLEKPYGVQMWNGRIYVCDLRNDAILILDLRNHHMLIMGRSGDEPLQRPTDIAIAPDGMKYVADLGRGLICVFDPQDRFVRFIGSEPLKPVGVAVYENELFVCDFQSQRVIVYDRTSGQQLRTIGESGNKPGQFVRPLGIATDEQGYVYVVDVFRCVLQKFDRQGKLIYSFGGISAGSGGMVRPKHLAVDHNGIIYIVDAAFQNVQLFDQQGHVLTYFGSAGKHPGAMYLPAGICIHDGDLDLFAKYIHPAFQAESLILVTNQFGDNKMSVYAMGRLKPGKTVADIASSKGLVPLGVVDPSKAPATQPTTMPAKPEVGPRR